MAAGQCKCMKLVYRMFYIRVYPYPVAHITTHLSASSLLASCNCSHDNTRARWWDQPPRGKWESIRCPFRCQLTASDARGKITRANCIEYLVYSDRGVNALLRCFLIEHRYLERLKCDFRVDFVCSRDYDELNNKFVSQRSFSFGGNYVFSTDEITLLKMLIFIHKLLLLELYIIFAIKVGYWFHILLIWKVK